ncbi:hypothetical protein F9C28_14465 [Shimwellia pseudoproteus]|uniref:hypothetical protein n=1 Tax=Shimwellia pseudoproteus TaxID=570012 RepID=UPI0018EB3825|nr:hypothetical protein [Shimwellia pseudoproteus]MBJ3816098.1 hypothetical protein [Shimwellia pseudoproteus]
MSASNSVKRGLVTLLAAVIAAGASTLCCVGPLLYLVFGISAAGLIGVPAFDWLQIPMIILSVGLMARGFWRLYLAPRPVCVNLISRRMLVWLYWLSVPLVLALLTYPWVLPWFLERNP